MSEKQNKEKIAGRHLRYLRGLGHHLKPLVTIGREGLSDNVVSAAEAVLAAHELVKIRIGNGCLLDRRETADMTAARTGAEVIQVLGKTFLLYRANPDLKDEQRIKLP